MYMNEDLLCGARLVSNGLTPKTMSKMPYNQNFVGNPQHELSLNGFTEDLQEKCIPTRCYANGSLSAGQG